MGATTRPPISEPPDPPPYDPVPSPQPGRNADFIISSADVGPPLPYIYGTGKVAAIFIEKFPVAEYPSAGHYLHMFWAALADGPIADITRIWLDKDIRLPLATLVWDGFTGALGDRISTGTNPNWWHDADLAYGDTAYIATDASSVQLVLGAQKETPNVQAEVWGYAFGATTPDVVPADIFTDLVTHARRGLGQDASKLHASISGTDADGWRCYTDTFGIRFSLVLDQYAKALDVATAVLRASNTDMVWSQGKWKAIPLDDEAASSHVYGSTSYAPSAVAAFDLGPDDFLEPLSFDTKRDADTYNDCPIEFTDRSADYGKQIVHYPDLPDIALRKLRRAPLESLPVIFPGGEDEGSDIPVMLSRIAVQRSLLVQNTYTARTSWKQILLEPGDWGFLTEPKLGLDHARVRIVAVERQIEEDGALSLELTAEDWPEGTASAQGWTPQTADGERSNFPGSLTGVSTTGLAAALSGATVTGSVTDTTAPRNILSATTGSVTVTASGGTGSYTYQWQQIDGLAATVNSPTAATTTFTRSGSCQAPANVFEGRYRCKVTDSSGAFIYTDPVTVRTTHLYEPP